MQQLADGCSFCGGRKYKSLPQIHIIIIVHIHTCVIHTQTHTSSKYNHYCWDHVDDTHRAKGHKAHFNTRLHNRGFMFPFLSPCHSVDTQSIQRHCNTLIYLSVEVFQQPSRKQMTAVLPAGSASKEISRWSFFLLPLGLLLSTLHLSTGKIQGFWLCYRFVWRTKTPSCQWGQFQKNSQRGGAVPRERSGGQRQRRSVRETKLKSHQVSLLCPHVWKSRMNSIFQHSRSLPRFFTRNRKHIWKQMDVHLLNISRRM